MCLLETKVTCILFCKFKILFPKGSVKFNVICNTRKVNTLLLEYKVKAEFTRNISLVGEFFRSRKLFKLYFI